MRFFFVRRSRRFLLAAAATAALTAGIAYAAIPDSGNVYHACVLKNVGTMRLIDTAKSGTLGRCTALEQEISWNASGAQGPVGPVGPKGDPGEPGAKG